MNRIKFTFLNILVFVCVGPMAGNSVFAGGAVEGRKISLEYEMHIQELDLTLAGLAKELNLNETISLLKKSIDQYPEGYYAYAKLGDVYYRQEEYEEALPYLLKALQKYDLLDNIPAQMYLSLHQGLFIAYYSIAEKYIFSEEICLRILYHSQEIVNANNHLGVQTESYVFQFMAEVLDKLQYAELGIKMINTTIDNESAMRDGIGERSEFNLPDDGISSELKLTNRQAAAQNVEQYKEWLKKSLYETVAADKTMEEIIAALREKFDAVKSLHYRNTDVSDGTLGSVSESMIEKDGGKLKFVDNRGISIIVGNDYFTLDPQTFEVIVQKERSIESMPYLTKLGIETLEDFQEDYNIEVYRLTKIPEIISLPYESFPTDQVYLLVGMSKDPDNNPVVRTDIIYDANLNLILANRFYLRGIQGSGRDIELAQDVFVLHIGKVDEEGFYFAGRTKNIGYAREFQHINNIFEIAIVSLNEDINDAEFELPQSIEK